MRLEESEAMFAYRSLDDIRRYQNWEPSGVDEIRTFIKDQSPLEMDTPGTWFQLGIFLRASNTLAGDCGFRFPPEETQQAEIGISLSPAYQGKGYATEVLCRCLDFLFDDLDKHRVFASVDPENTKSIHLLERIGMRKEAHFHESLWFKGRWADDIVFAILEKEWRSLAGVTRTENG
jgi:RimJ/RimL family protein N-acetyltransferase